MPPIVRIREIIEITLAGGNVVNNSPSQQQQQQQQQPHEQQQPPPPAPAPNVTPAIDVPTPPAGGTEVVFNPGYNLAPKVVEIQPPPPQQPERAARTISHTTTPVASSNSNGSSGTQLAADAANFTHRARVLAGQTARVAEVLDGGASVATSFVPAKFGSAASLLSNLSSRLEGANFLTGGERLAGGLVENILNVIAAPAEQLASRIEGAFATSAASVLPRQRFFEFAHLGSPLALLSDSVAGFIDDSASIPTVVAQARPGSPWTLTFSVVAADVFLLGYVYRRRAISKRRRQAFARVATPAYPFYG